MRDQPQPVRDSRGAAASLQMLERQKTARDQIMTEEEADHKQAITTEEKDMAARKEEKTATRLALRAVELKKRTAEEAHHTADR